MPVKNAPKASLMSDVGGIGGTPGTNGLGSSALTGPQTAATALSALRRHAVSSIEISDTAQNIARNLDALQGYAGKITGLSTTDTNQNLVVTGTQYQRDRAILAVWGAGSGQTVGITAAKASTVTALPSYVTSVSVADSSANIARYLDTLQTLASGGVLSEIVQTGSASNLSITSDQLTADQDALDKIKNHGYSLAITNASVSDVLGLDSQTTPLSANAKVRTISIVDTTDAIASNLDALQKVGLRIKNIAQTDAATPLEITGTQYKNDRTVLGKIITSDLLAVMDASAAQMYSLAADHKVVTVEVQDTANNLSRNWSLLEKLADSLTSVNVSDQANAIHVTSAQFAGSTALLSKFTDTTDQSYKLQVTNVSSESALAVANSHNVVSVDVADSAANLVTNMADLKTINTQGQLNSITQSGAGPLLLDVSLLQGPQLADTQGILNKFKGQNYTLAVAGVATSALADLTVNKRVVSVTVSDSSDNLESALVTLKQLGGRLKGIDQTDAGTAFHLTQTEMEGNTTVLSKIAGGYTANLTGVTAKKAAADALNTHVASMVVSDTGSNILAHWAELRAIGANLDSVSQSDNSALKLSADNYQLGVHDGLVAKLGLSSTFSVTDASVEQAQAISGDQAVAQIAVAAQGDVIVENMATLATLVTGGKLTSITNQNPFTSLALNASQLTSAQPVLDVIKGGSYTLAMSGVDVADAKDLLTDNHKIASVAVTGVAADIVSKLSELNTIGRKLTTITQTDSPVNTLDMTGQAFEANSAALAKIVGGFLAVLSDVSATKAASYANNASVGSMAVSDTGDNLANAWASLGDLGSKLTDVTQSDATTLQLNANDWLQGQTLRGKISSDLGVSLSGADVSQVATLATDDAVEAIQVSDSADALSAALTDLASQTKLTQVVVQDPAVALTLSAATYADSATATLLGLVKDGHYSVALSDVAAQDVTDLNTDAHVTSMDVTDTSSEVSTNFATLAAATKLNSIALSDVNGTVTLTANQILDNSSTLDQISGSYQLAATNVATIDLAAIQDVPQTSSISISDTSDNVSANFSDILALGDTLTHIALTDSSPVLSLSQHDWTAGADALSTISDTYQVDVSGTVAGDAQTVAADISVRNVTVADTASNVASNWNTLVGLYNDGAGKLTGISLSDANPLVLTADQQVAGAAMLTALLPDETIQTAP